nr:hypothetical protein [Tanacetum cinerariifolium]
EDGNPARANVKQALGRSYALSWKPCQGDSLNLPDHRYSIYTVKWYIVDVAASFQLSRIHIPHAHTQAFKVNQEYEQLSSLISLIKDNSLNGKNGQANLAGANQHMTHIDKELDNVYDISHLRIKVGHPNGT